MNWQPIDSNTPRGKPIMILLRLTDCVQITVDTLSDGTIEYWEKVSDKKKVKRSIPALFTSDGQELVGDWWAPWEDPGEVPDGLGYHPSYTRMY